MKAIHFLIPVLFAIGFIQFAKADTIGMHVGTHHSSNIYCDNGENPGLYYSHEETGITLGTYRNSCGRQSLYVGWISPDWHGLSAMAIVATNYNSPLPLGLFGGVFPTYRLDLDKSTSIRVSGMALFKTEVFHFSIDRKF